MIGPTASGKTALAIKLADILNGEIISADSRQVYKKMDIGTGKDLSSYYNNGKKIRCHLIDIHESGYKYNVYEYQKDFYKIYKELTQRKVYPILCGGSGLYIQAVLQQYNLIHVPINQKLRNSLINKSLFELKTILEKYKKLHNNTDTDTTKRAIRAIEIAAYYQVNNSIKTSCPIFNHVLFGIQHDRQTLKKKITQRLIQRIDNGMITEVKDLLNTGLKPEDLIYYGLEYKYITLYLLNMLSYDEMISKLNIAIHQFAKRQMTWFRRMERNNLPINWIDGSLPLDEKVQKVLQVLEKSK